MEEAVLKGRVCTWERLLDELLQNETKVEKDEIDLIPIKRDGRDSLGIKKAYEVINNDGILRDISRRNKKRTY